MHYHLTKTEVTQDNVVKLVDSAFVTKESAYQSLPRAERPKLRTRHWKRGIYFYDICACYDTDCLVLQEEVQV